MRSSTSNVLFSFRALMCTWSGSDIVFPPVNFDTNVFNVELRNARNPISKSFHGLGCLLWHVSRNANVWWGKEQWLLQTESEGAAWGELSFHTFRCLWNCWTIFAKAVDWRASNSWAMSASASTDDCGGGETADYEAPQLKVDSAMMRNCRPGTILTFALEKTSWHKQAFSWASRLPMLGISSLKI